MIRKSLGFLLLVGLAAVSGFAQKTPEEKRPEAKAFAFTFGGDGFLGIYPEEVSKDNFSKFGLRDVRGAAIKKVEENGPAAKAGLMANDVIIKFNDEEVTSVRKLNRLISETAPDHVAKIVVLRNGQEMEFSATIERRKFESFNGTFTMPRVEMPEMPKMPAITPGAAWTTKGDGQAFYFSFGRQIGVSVSSLSKQLGEYFGVDDGKGVLVTAVQADSPAAKAGIKAGDVIVEVDGKAIANNLELVRAIAAKKEGSVNLTFVRDKSRRSVSVTPENAKEIIAPGEIPKSLTTVPAIAPIDMN